MRSILELRTTTPTLVVWGTLAAASLAVAVVVGLQPGRLRDLTTVVTWLDVWIATGLSPYAVPALSVDYPPYAFLILAPLHWVAAVARAEVFLALKLVSVVWMAWMVARWLATTVVSEDRHSAAIFAFALLAWGAVRIEVWNGQTLALSLGAGALALRLTTSHPRLAALLFVVAACKPNLGLALGLAMLLRGDWRVVALAAGIGAGLTAVFGATVGQPPWTPVADYLGSLQVMYASEDYVRGVTSLRAALTDVTDAHPWASEGFALFAAALLALLVLVGWRARRRADLAPLWVSACLLWSLAALPNQRYYLILLAPTVWLLLRRPDLFTAHSARWPRQLGVWLLIFNVLDVPLLLRLFAESIVFIVPAAGDTIFLLWWSSYKVAAPVILGLFALTLRRLWVLSESHRRRPQDPQGPLGPLDPRTPRTPGP